MTLGEAVSAGTTFLDENKVSFPRLSAEILLSHCLGVERPYLYSHDKDEIEATLLTVYKEMLDRKSDGEPLQHITGIQEFFGRIFKVNSSVLIPRPETELVVETICNLNEWTKPAIIDVGTGSGCIGATLALEIPNARVFGVDLSHEAINIARENSINLDANLLLTTGDLLDAYGNSFEFIVSNPPYVDSKDYPNLQKEVRDYEPHIALFANDGTLSIYKRLIPQAYEHLVEGGYMVVEIGFSLEEKVRTLFPKGWELLPTRTDLQGIPRVIAARKSFK